MHKFHKWRGMLLLPVLIACLLAVQGCESTIPYRIGENGERIYDELRTDEEVFEVLDASAQDRMEQSILRNTEVLETSVCISRYGYESLDEIDSVEVCVTTADGTLSEEERSVILQVVKDNTAATEENTWITVRGPDE